MQPLDGITVIDFSSLLPGPMATLILVEAGARVIKIEPPECGDCARSYTPGFGRDSVNFALLNRGKRSIAIDLKKANAVDRLAPLITGADVLVEQFRPGVMERLGLGYQKIAKMNPRLIYCSITGYGQTGPKALAVGHDLSYMADTGLLEPVGGVNEATVAWAAGITGIAGGGYPAAINILLALQQRERTGIGCKLDVAICDNLLTLSMYRAIGLDLIDGGSKGPENEFARGKSPRYQIYLTKDDQLLAVGAIEQKFWDNLCELIELDGPLRDDSIDPAETKSRVAAIIRSKNGDHWRERIAGQDICCAVAESIGAVLKAPHFRERGLFDARVTDPDGASMTAFRVPVVPPFRGAERDVPYPRLGEANGLVTTHQPPRRRQTD